MSYPGAFFIHLPGIYWILTRCQVPFKTTEPTNRYLRKLLIIMRSTMVGDGLVEPTIVRENTMGAVEMRWRLGKPPQVWFYGNTSCEERKGRKQALQLQRIRRMDTKPRDKPGPGKVDKNGKERLENYTQECNW